MQLALEIIQGKSTKVSNDHMFVLKHAMQNLQGQMTLAKTDKLLGYRDSTSRLIAATTVFLPQRVN